MKWIHLHNRSVQAMRPSRSAMTQIPEWSSRRSLQCLHLTAPAWKLALCLLLFLSAPLFQPMASMLSLSAQALTGDKYQTVITGTVTDKESRARLENVTVVLVGTSIGTVTNADGTFSLKIPRQSKAAVIEFSHIGYLNARYSVPGTSTTFTARIAMTPTSHQLSEVTVYGGDARRIVEEAVRRIPDNFPTAGNLLDVFYRETVQKRHRYTGISEAMMNVYKTSYTHRTPDNDRVQLTKARRLLSQRERDTLAVKVAGGPNLALTIDLVKNADALLDLSTLDFYDYRMELPTFLDERQQFVITFVPRVNIDYPLFYGTLYIDCEQLTFTRAEFSLDLSDHDKAVSSILEKKPAGLRFRLQEVKFIVTYRREADTSSLNYICNEMRFKCDWKKRLFSSTYTTRSEMVVVDRNEHPDRAIARRDAFKPGEVFYDVVKEYWNPDYWKDYNILEPTESLESAVKRLRKQL